MSNSTKGKEIPARPVGELCTSLYCIKFNKGDCQDISRDVQLAIFKYFWVDLTEWPERKVYVSTLVSKMPIKQNTTGVTQEDRTLGNIVCLTRTRSIGFVRN